MAKKETLEEFKKRFYEKFPNSNIEILNFIIKNRNRIYVKFNTKYGKCLRIKEQLIKNKNRYEKQIYASR
jgi:hypothetical protein